MLKWEEQNKKDVTKVTEQTGSFILKQQNMPKPEEVYLLTTYNKNISVFLLNSKKHLYCYGLMID